MPRGSSASVDSGQEGEDKQSGAEGELYLSSVVGKFPLLPVVVLSSCHVVAAAAAAAGGRYLSIACGWKISVATRCRPFVVSWR